MKRATDTAAQRIADEFDLRNLPPEFYENPFPYYAALRAESPVKRLPDGTFFVTRYDDAEFVYRIPRSSARTSSRNLALNMAPHRCLNTTPRAWYSMTRPSIPECAGSSTAP